MSVVFGEGKILVKRRMSIVASALLVGVTTATFVGGTPVGAQTAGGVPFGTADFGGYSTGTVIHADAINVGTTRVADAEVAFSGASAASKGFAAQQVNEVDQIVIPADATKESFARGSGLEVGLATTTPTVDNTLILQQKAVASANPPNDTGLINAEVGPVDLNPVAYASLLRGQAQARWEDNRCVVGEPISKGLGYAADAQLVNLGGAAPGGGFQAPIVATDIPAGTPTASAPARAVSQSESTTQLFPNGQGAFGLQTETRMTIAPVTLLKGSASPITLEFLGEWVLRAWAPGTGPAVVHYGPGTVSPATPVVRILQGTTVVEELLTQEIPLLGQAGLVVPLPALGIEVAIGEDPRAIGGDAESKPTAAANGTEASGAVDVVRLRVLDNPTLVALGLSVADVRIGHMEVKAKVPAGGIKCSLPVNKVSDKQTVNAGDNFTYSITVTNPFADCELTQVRVVDNITVTQGVRYNITGTNPAATSQTANQVVWNDIGPIGPKQSKTVTISIAIPANSAAGQFTNNAVATGNCATGSAQGGAKITVPITGETTVVVPSVSGGRELPATAVDVLPRTGSSGPAMALTGLALLGAALGLRRFRAHSLR